MTVSVELSDGAFMQVIIYFGTVLNQVLLCLWRNNS